LFRTATGTGATLFNFIQNVPGFLSQTAENNVAVIQMRCLVKANEKLTSIAVGARISHRKNTANIMLSHEVLISELFTINGLTTCTVVVREITTLGHKAGDDAMEY